MNCTLINKKIFTLANPLAKLARSAAKAIAHEALPAEQHMPSSASKQKLPVKTFFTLKKSSLVLIVWVTMVVSGGGTSNVVYGKTTLSFATLSPKSAIWGRFIRDIVREVYTKSDKDMLIRVYYGGVQGDEGEMKDKIALGQLDGGFFTGNGLGALAEEVRILEVPGLITNYQAAAKVYAELLPTFNKYFNTNGYELLALSELGFAYFYSQQPIKSLNDIKKTRMWLWKGDRFAAKIMAALNIPVIAVSFIEVLPSLQTGLIDGVYATPTGLLSLEWQTQVKYMLALPLTLVSSGIVLSKRKWNTLSPAQQTLLRTVVNRQLARYRPLFHAKEQESTEALLSIGIEKLSSTDNLGALTAQSHEVLEIFPAALRSQVNLALKKN